MLNEDYKEMLQCLADEHVKFLLVGAYPRRQSANANEHNEA
jgi:hypothetical protein